MDSKKTLLLNNKKSLPVDSKDSPAKLVRNPVVDSKESPHQTLNKTIYSKKNIYRQDSTEFRLANLLLMIEDCVLDVMPLDVVIQFESKGSVRVQRTRDFRIDPPYVGNDSMENLCTLDPDRESRILAYRDRIQNEMKKGK